MALLPRPTVGDAFRAGVLLVAVVRFARGARRDQPIRSDPAGPPDSMADVTVLIPARDEADRIGACVRSLAPTGAQVIVIDDGSSDETRTVATEAGATVVSAGSLPEGWAGKAHALQVGLEIAATTVVVAVDADTRAAPGFLPVIVDALGDRALVTAGARVDAPDAGGRLVHASMLATIVYRFGPPGVPACRASREMANGQCMVFDRATLVAAGGFANVADSLIEDVELARSLSRCGHDVSFVDATDVLEVEGYGSARDTLDGWGRSLSLRETTSAPWMVADLAVIWSTMALPLPRLLARRGDLLDVAALALRFGVVMATRSAFRQRGWPLLLAPLADVVVATRLTKGALRPTTTWKGRTYTGS